MAYQNKCPNCGGELEVVGGTFEAQGLVLQKDGFCTKEEPKAATTFTADDVLSKRLEWSREEALKFLIWARKQIEADMTERGWESIDILLDMYEESDNV